MPKPPTHQRPIPVNRNWSGRPGAPSSPPPFGKPGKKKEQRPAPEPGVELQLGLRLPKLPPLKR